MESDAGATVARVPTLDRADALIALSERYLPRYVHSDGDYGDWAVIGPGFVALCARALESVFHLPPPRHRGAAAMVARSLVDYAITFAWLAGPTEDQERERRLTIFVRHELEERRKADNRYRAHLGERSPTYKRLIEGGQMPSELLDDHMLEFCRNRLAGDAPKRMPSILDRAIGADSDWIAELPMLEQQPLAHIYGIFYSRLSMLAHGSAFAVSTTTMGEPPDLLVGLLDSEPGASGIYDLSCSVFTIMLFMASRRLGWPDWQEVVAATVAAPVSGGVRIERPFR